MTRVSVIVSVWLLLTGGVGDAVLAGHPAPLRLLLFYFGSSALTALALWVELQKDGAPRRNPPPRRDRRAYD